MKKLIYLFIFIALSSAAHAQQAVLYSQFLLNNYGLNPAVAGSKKGWNVMMGHRAQWQGFDYGPETTFASIVVGFGKKNFKRYWHGVGAYVEQDKFGAFTTKVVYASYAFNLKLSHKYSLSFGVAAGTKAVSLNNSFFDANDPAIVSRAPKVLIPDVIPGLYFYSNKLSIGVSVRNIYKNTLQQDNKKIGTPSKLPQVAYVTLSRKIRSQNYDYVFVPAIQLQSTFTNFPLAQFNCITYYRETLGLGLSYRMHDAVSAMLQIRLWQKVVIGFAYDYTVSKLRSANANSSEIMIGFIPSGLEDYEVNTNRVSKCPKFDY